jgi:uncharacterized iron-regulated membrane protein
MPRFVHTLLLLAAIGLALPVGAPGAQHWDPSGGASRFDGQGLSLDEAVQRAQRRYKARAVKAAVAGDGERRVYVIRLMNDQGRVWTVHVDAQTGKMR